MRHLLSLSLIAALCTLSACASYDMRDDAYAPAGQVDALLSASSENVRYSVEDEMALESLASWIQEDAPTRATLSCVDMGSECDAIQAVLEQHSVPFNVELEADAYQAELVYERIIAKPCDVGFRSNHTNSSNMNHSDFGCATSMNILQMVDDYHQFTNPAKRAPHDAEMAVKNTRRYQGINDPYYPY